MEGREWHLRQYKRLEPIQEDLCYIIECRVEEMTGEAKGEISRLSGTVERMEDLEAGWRKEIITQLDAIREGIRGDSFNRSAWEATIMLRRKIANTRAHLRRKGDCYNFAGSFLEGAPPAPGTEEDLDRELGLELGRDLEPGQA